MSARLLYVIAADWFFCSHFLARAQAMRAAGYDVHVATPVAAHGAAIRAAGLTLHPLLLRRSATGLWGEARALLHLIALMRKLRPQIVHHIALKPILYGSLAVRLSRCDAAIINAPVGMGYVFASRQLRARFLRVLVEAGLRLLLNPRRSRVVFENREDMDGWIARGVVRAEDAVLIPGAGVDLTQFAPQPPPITPPVIVTLTARMLVDKGVGEFVAAATSLRAAGVGAEFWLVGDVDPDNPATLSRAQLQSWHESGVVKWWGQRSDIAAILAQSHIVCLPSYREGLPKSLIEALAAGLPVVTTDVVGCREVVAHDGNGLLVPARDAGALAAALRRLIEDAALRARFGAAGRARAEALYGQKAIIAATRALYDGLPLRTL